MTVRRLPSRSLPWLALVTSLASLASPDGASEPEAILTNEDVVRRFLAAGSAEEVIRQIDRAPACRFELDEEMTAELRAAGLPGSILEAMRRCQRRSQPEDRAPPAPALAAGRLELRFSSPDEAGDPWRHSVAVLSGLPPSLAGEASEFHPPDSLAFFAVCRTPEHVPDHWRLATRLREEPTPRHRLLAFKEGSAEVELEKIHLRYLVPPGSYRVPVEEGLHDLAIGVAARAAGEWRVVAWEPLGEIPVARASSVAFTVRMETRLERRGRGPRLPRSSLEAEGPAVGAAGPDGAPSQENGTRP